MGLTVLSLFDGMSCGQIALRELGIKVDAYYASEIDKFCIAQTQLNFPDTIQLGDVRGVTLASLPKIDLILAGSPCQGFSFAGKQLNFEDPRSVLFFQFQRIAHQAYYLNPDMKFLLENVRMKKSSEEIITRCLDGLRPVVINSALVSAQNRVRPLADNSGMVQVGMFRNSTIPNARQWVDGRGNQTHIIIFERMSLINNIKQQITEATVELSTPEYVEFMRELANWAEDRANIAEYEPDFNTEEE